jgi:hypothetical protein
MSYAGFDSLAYPGDAMMQWLKSHTNLSFVGFYLAPAPSRPTSGWMGKYTTLAAQGWGFAPIYVGQQEASQPGSHNLNAAQGTADGQAAVGLMRTAGFPANSVVYLDCEQGGAASQARQAYVGAWVDAVAPSSYKPGIYCSYTTAASLLAIRPNVCVWVWHITNPAPGPTFPTPDPGSSGTSKAMVLQYFQNTTVNFPGAPVASLKIDLDSSSVADPSKAPVPVVAVSMESLAPAAAMPMPIPTTPSAATSAAPSKKAAKKARKAPKRAAKAKKAAKKAAKKTAAKTPKGRKAKKAAKTGKRGAGKKGRKKGRKTGR